MKPCDFDWLQDALRTLEQQTLAIPLGDFPSASFIRDAGVGSQIQGYGLDKSTSGQSLPLVICIGGNYSQAKTVVPRDFRCSDSSVLDDLTTCRSNLRKGLDHYAGARSTWASACAASSSTIRLPIDGAFHLVMTNFCLWITRQSWQNLGSQVRADLLENNVPHNGKGTGPGQWEHLISLRKVVSEYEVTWVGHGIHSEVFALFRQFMRNQDAPWLLMPNLAFYYDYANWNLLKGIPDAHQA